ncbi:hypothetical protein [Nonomuraea sp. B1E8]
MPTITLLRYLSDPDLREQITQVTNRNGRRFWTLPEAAGDRMGVRARLDA